MVEQDLGAVELPSETRVRAVPLLGAPAEGRAAGPVPERFPRPGRLRRWALGISPDETRPERRGFTVDDAGTAERLARVGRTFLAGYHCALADPRPEPLADRLEALETGWRGFAYEGAGLGLALLDVLSPWPARRLRRFVAGPAARHRYLVYVGAGWTLARVPRRLGAMLAGLDDTVLQWLALDGYGFHYGFFDWRRSVVGPRRVPRRLTGYARRAFDLGLGRSLWFVHGMDPGRISASIDGFAAERRGPLWSGVGLACAFAGGLAPEGVAELRLRAGAHAPDAAQGAAFGARAHLEADDEPGHLDEVCRRLCGLSAREARTLTEEAEAGLPADDGSLHNPEPAYETWRLRTRRALAEEALGAGRADIAEKETPK